MISSRAPPDDERAVRLAAKCKAFLAFKYLWNPLGIEARFTKAIDF